MKKLILLFLSIITVLAQTALGGLELKEFLKKDSASTLWVDLPREGRMPHINIRDNDLASGNTKVQVSIKLQSTDAMSSYSIKLKAENDEIIRIFNSSASQNVNFLFNCEIELKQRCSRTIKVEVYKENDENFTTPIGRVKFFLNVLADVKFDKNTFTNLLAGIVPGEKRSIKIDGFENGKNIESVIFKDSEGKTPQRTELQFEVQTDDNSVTLKDLVINNSDLLNKGYFLHYVPMYFKEKVLEKPKFEEPVKTNLELKEILQLYKNNLNVTWYRTNNNRREKVESKDFYPGISTQTFVARIDFNNKEQRINGQPQFVITPNNNEVEFKGLDCPACQSTLDLQTYEYQLTIKPNAKAQPYEVKFNINNSEPGVTSFQVMKSSIPMLVSKDKVYLEIDKYEKQSLDGITREVHHEDEFKEFKLVFKNASGDVPQYYRLDMSIMDEDNNLIELLSKEITITEVNDTITIDIENKAEFDVYVEKWNRLIVKLSPVLEEYQLSKEDQRDTRKFEFKKEILYTGSTLCFESRKWVPFFNLFGFSSYATKGQLPYNSLFNLGIGVATYGVDKRNKLSNWGFGASLNFSNPDNAFSRDSLRKPWGFSMNLIARYTGINEFPLTIGFGPGWAYLRENENNQSEQPKYKLKFGLNYGIYVNTSLSKIF